MAGAAPNEGTRRRLPRWMVAPPANDQARESSCKDGNTDQINEGVVSPQRTNSKSLTKQPKRASSLQEKNLSKVGGFGLVECGRKRRKRRASEEEDGSDVSTHEIVEDKKERRRGRRKAQDSVFEKRRKTKSLVAEGVEEHATFASDDDVELTVEDLLSIAEEVIFFVPSPEKNSFFPWSMIFYFVGSCSCFFFPCYYCKELHSRLSYMQNTGCRIKHIFLQRSHSRPNTFLCV